MARSKAGSRLQERFFTLGKVLLLAGILFTAFLFGAILGMRLAVRGTEVVVPDLVEMSLEDARQRLKEVKLNLTVSGQRYDSQVPEGCILSQLPSAGVHIKANRNIQVIVSLGPRANPVPQLVGSSLRVARLLAAQNGYELGNISTVRLPGFPADQVIQQFPPPDSTESTGDRIDVLVNQAPEPVFVMPHVIGQNLNKVLLFFERNQIKVNRIQYRDSDRFPRRTVIRQFPEPGYPLTPKDAVNLEVAR